MHSSLMQHASVVSLRSPLDFCDKGHTDSLERPLACLNDAADVIELFIYPLTPVSVV